MSDLHARNPFAQLIRAATVAPTAAPARPAPLASGSRTAAMLALLRSAEDGCTTADLANAAGVPQSTVHALLKSHRTRGQILVTDGIWYLNRQWVRPEVRRACDLLQAEGYVVISPEILRNGEATDIAHRPTNSGATATDAREGTAARDR